GRRGHRLIEAYLSELVSRLHGALGDELLGVYAGGSLALGDYRPGRSDVDVAVVVRERATAARRAAVIDAVRHESLPCPAGVLELVVYRREVAGTPSPDPGFDLNLNTGDGIPLRVDEDAGLVGAHWFAIDRDVLARHGRALYGPPPDEVFAPIPRE